MVNTPAVASEAGLATWLAERQLDDIAKQLRRSTVFFVRLDEARRTTEVIGSGVVADLGGAKVVLTAGHVLNDYAGAFVDGQVSLSVHRARGHMKVRSDSDRLITAGGLGGADAGVLILPPDHVETYIQFSGVEPIRMSTLRLVPPASGMDCMIAGYPKSGAVSNTVEDRNTLEVRLTPTIAVVVAHFREADELHYWLDAGAPAMNLETGDDVEFRPGDLNGMSGCGFWTIEASGDQALFVLHGVHTGTGDKRLRETPVAHHLRLLARHRREWRDVFAARWPSLSNET